MGLSCNSSSVGMDFLHSFMSRLPQPASPLVLINHSNTAGSGNPDMNECRKSIPTLELLQESPILNAGVYFLVVVAIENRKGQAVSSLFNWAIT